MEIKCTKKCEKEYPKRLLKMENAPNKLYYLGDILLLDKNIVALIGKRDVSEKVMKTTKRCGEILAECGTVVLNGLAIGCDTAGLEGALTAGGKDHDLMFIILKADVIVEGRYEKDKRDVTLKWRGSANQRVIDVQKSFHSGKVILHCN